MDRSLAIAFAVIGIAAFAVGRKVIQMSNQDAIVGILKYFLPSVEGFSDTPYWDVSRYSWGYGTQAPGSTGEISRDQAMEDMLKHVFADYNLLLPQIHRTLNPNQWAALLSFSYNEGAGNAQKLIPDIDSYDDQKLGAHWRLYVYADHVVNEDLVDRRQREWELFTT